MIHKLSYTIAIFFRNKALIDEKELDTCCYGFEIILSTLLGFALIILSGALLGDFSFGILYLLYIVPIRMCVGGYHAKTYFKCNTVFLLFFGLAFFWYRIFSIGAYQILGWVNLICVFVILVLAPLENENKVMSESKRKKYKVIDILIYIIGGILGIYFPEVFLVQVLSIVLSIVVLLLFLGKGVEKID